jgi:NTP pyrophosphatase (non-canonical NTP hydrolase)
MNKLNKKILQWATDKDILAKGTPDGQIAKTLEELIETAQAVALFDFEQDESVALDAVKDGIGDVYVTIVIHAQLKGLPSFPEFTYDDRSHDNKYIFNSISKLITMIISESNYHVLANIYAGIATGLVKLAANHNLTLRECVEHSYNVIAKRNGKMQDGVFIKD